MCVCVCVCGGGGGGGPGPTDKVQKVLTFILLPFVGHQLILQRREV